MDPSEGFQKEAVKDREDARPQVPTPPPAWSLRKFGSGKRMLLYQLCVSSKLYTNDVIFLCICFLLTDLLDLSCALNSGS